LAERLASPNFIVVGRVEALLRRVSILRLLNARDGDMWEELAAIYHEHFGCGELVSKVHRNVGQRGVSHWFDSRIER